MLAITNTIVYNQLLLGRIYFKIYYLNLWCIFRAKFLKTLYSGKSRVCLTHIKDQ